MATVTITAPAQGNEPVATPARAKAALEASAIAPAANIAALASELERRWAAEHAMWESDHTDEEAEALVAGTGEVAHQLMALPATTLADFRAKARAIEWALSGGWEHWSQPGTHSDFAKALILELLGDARRRDLTSGGSPPTDAAPAPTAEPIAEGHAKSEPAPDPTTPLGLAIAAREALRRERQAWEDAHEADAPEELEDRVSAAEFAVYETPARSVAEIRWKLLEDVKEAQARWSHDDAEEYLKSKGGLDGAAQRGILYDLDALAELKLPAFAQDREFLDETAHALDLFEESYALGEAGDDDGASSKRAAAEKVVSRLLEQRPTTIAGALARARLLDHHAPTEAFEDHAKIEWQIARALIGDVKALFCGRPSVNVYGRAEISALWSAARLAAYTKGDTYPPPPKMATGASSELLAAE